MRILCAVDGSECSHWGIQTLEALAGREPESVTLLHVVDPSALRVGRGRNPVAEKRALAAMEKAGGILLREAERSARVALGQAATSPRTKFHTILTHGPLARTIVRQARRVKADLILIGSRGLSDIQGFLLGSISRQVASIAPCSVFVVKQPILELRRVTLAVDDSKYSRASARFLRSRILPESATTTILSSAERPVTDLAVRYLSKAQVAELERPVIDGATRLVTTLRNEFLKDGYSVDTDVQMNHVIDTIVKHVEAHHADLLVVGSRDLTKSERLHFGSVSESLLRHTPCSVLIVRGTRA
ncbi:MAG TPA: universal stress protein [Nitrospiraceae bacterium]|nr:universal stress protein [Nitrospiraceae bacterium]